MTIKYKLTHTGAIIRTDGERSATIAPDPANHDYQDYLTWLSMGGAPDPAPLPATEVLACNRFQMRAGLRRMGWLAQVDAAVKQAAMTDPDMLDAWLHTTEFRRDNDRIAQIASAIGRTDEDLDNLFTLCMTLKP
jgi:hypothetical protein